MPLSPRSLVDVYECAHRVALKKAEAGGMEFTASQVDEVIVELGHAHEDAVVTHLEAELGRPLGRQDDGTGEILSQDELLVNSHQARLTTPDGLLYGIPDLLLDAQGLRALGAEHFEGVVLEPVDVKLSRTSKARALLQVAVYGEMLHRLGYPRPQRGHLVLGTTDDTPYRVESHLLGTLYPLVRALIDQHRAVEPVQSGDRLWGERSSACTLCPFNKHCEDGRRLDNDLSLLANVLPTQRRLLNAAGIQTVRDLTEAERAPRGMAEQTFTRLIAQARLRSEQITTGVTSYQFTGPGTGHPEGPVTLRYPLERKENGQRPPGAAKHLPKPDPYDIFFDFEGYPHAPRGGLEYLFGWVTNEGPEPDFHYLWADDEAAERAAFEEFIEALVERFKDHPDAHVYHYAPYEKTALRRLASKYRTREVLVEELIAADRFVDLYPIVTGAVVVGAGSYSIKKLEPLYMPAGRTGEVTSAGDSILQYLEYSKALAVNPAEAEELRESILEYNEYDCVSTLRLRNWLHENRSRALGAGPTVQEEPVEYEKSEKKRIREETILRLETQLSHVQKEMPELEEWREGLAALVGFYAREEKLYWGDVMRKYDLSDSELAEDDDVAVVERIGQVIPKPGKRATNSYLELILQRPSILRKTVLARNGESMKSPKTVPSEIMEEVAENLGTSVHSGENSLWVDANADTIGGMLEQRTLLHKSLVSPGKKESTLFTIAESAVEGEVSSAVGLAAVARTGMRTQGALQGDVVEQALSAVEGLEEGSYVAVQGPPGAGKTYLSVKVLKDAAARSWSVGVCCLAHKAYENVLLSAHKEGIPVVVHARSDGESSPVEESMKITDWAGLPTGGRSVLGGTVFAWANLAQAVLEGSAEPVDLLVIDEASQMPLVDLIAISPAAKRMVLLGDPCQLPHISQATHPEGWDVSVLEHLVGEENVMPKRHGFFLDETRRFPPALATVVSEIAYDGRLMAHPETSEHHAGGEQGAFCVPVEHVGRSTASPEEAAEIVRLSEMLLGTEARTRSGTIILEEKDIIVVAPYNDQVRTIQEALSEAGMKEVRVGTVDRFQGQEAAVSIYSMTASSAEDAPRGPEFVLDTARLNVALSRAQAVAVVVGNPALTRVPGTSLEALYTAGRACSVLLDLPRWTIPPEDVS